MLVQLAPGVWQLEGRPRNLINVYLLGDVLIDSATRYDAGRIIRAAQGRALSAHALTHAHPDHIGSSHAVCERLGIPFWVGGDDAAAAEDPGVMSEVMTHAPFAAARVPARLLTRAYVASQVARGHHVERRLSEGDVVGGFTVLRTPGHTAGHVSYWREADRVLIAGDVLWNFHFFDGRPGLTEPVGPASLDPAQNRDSARRLAALEPELVCFGHGPPLRDPARFREFVAQLP